jgi:NADH-quinone oxidoreductase subunit M
MTEFLASIGYQRWVLSALLVLPLVGALAVMVVPARRLRETALAFSLAEFVVSLGLWFAYDQSNAAMQFTLTLPWLPDWGIMYRVGVDGISLMLVLLTTGLTPLAVLSSWEYIHERQRPYYALLLTLLTGMIGVFVALDLFVFYVFWEIMLIPMYFIIGIWGGTERLYAAIKFFIYTFLGSLLMLVAILVMVWQAAHVSRSVTFGYEDLLAHAPMFRASGPWLFAAFALAFAIKVPVFPFHTWLPDAHVQAPTAGSAILAGVLLKMGTYGFLRFAVPFFPTVAFSPFVTSLAVTLAVTGVIYGALVSMVQPDLKKLVAYSSVSHLGFAMLGIWSGTVQGVQGALMIGLNHGLSTGALFLLIGMIYERRHTRLISDFGGLARVMPHFAILFTITALASIAVPGLNGFVGEFLVLLGSFGRHPWATSLATTGVIFAAAYLLWAVQRVLLGPLDNPANAGLKDLSARELCVILPLVAGMVWIGVYPRPILDRMEVSAQHYLDLAQPGLVQPGTRRPAQESR